MEQTLYNLLLQDARFLLGAEAEQQNRLRELVQNVSDPDLRSLLEEHADETSNQIRRLEEILRAAGEEGDGEIPSAVDGLIEDAEMMVDLEIGEQIRDVALAAAARKMEHYEIACYESSIAIAEQLGLQDVLGPLRESLDEERRADQRLALAAMKLIQEQVPRETEPARP